MKGVFGNLGGGLRSAGGAIAATLGPVKQGLRTMSTELGQVFRPLIRRSPVLVIVLSVLVAASGIAYLLLMRSDHDHDDEVQARKEASAVAKETVTRIFSYQYDTMDEELANVEDLLTGSFKDEYSNLMRTQLAPRTKEQKIHIKTDVVGDAVLASDRDKVKLLLFFNQESTSPTLQQPLRQGGSIKVTLKKHDGHWLISALDPV